MQRTYPKNRDRLKGNSQIPIFKVTFATRSLVDIEMMLLDMIFEGVEHS